MRIMMRWGAAQPNTRHIPTAWLTRGLLSCFKTDEVSLSKQICTQHRSTVPRNTFYTKELRNIEVVLQKLPLCSMDLWSRPHSRNWIEPTTVFFRCQNLKYSLAGEYEEARRKLFPKQPTHKHPSCKWTRRSALPAALKSICSPMNGVSAPLPRLPMDLLPQCTKWHSPKTSPHLLQNYCNIVAVRWEAKETVFPGFHPFVQSSMWLSAKHNIAEHERTSWVWLTN